MYSDKHCNLEVWSETPVNTRGYMTSGCHSVGAKAKSVNIVCEDYVSVAPSVFRLETSADVAIFAVGTAGMH